ncbi:unnamed protein product, partial [Cylicocyclus nassatus]
MIFSSSSSPTPPQLRTLHFSFASTSHPVFGRSTSFFCCSVPFPPLLYVLVTPCNILLLILLFPYHFLCLLLFLYPLRNIPPL